MKLISNYIGKLSVMLSLLFLAGACDQPDYPEPNTTANTEARASIQVINTSPGSTPINLSIDNVLQNGNIPYLSTFNNGYLPIFGGQRLLEINNFDPSNAVKTIALRQVFNTNTNYTVFLTDLPTRTGTGSDPGGVRYLVVTDNLQAPSGGKAGIRFLNVAPGSSSFGLYNTITQQSILPTSKTFTTKAGTAGTINNLQNRAFREVSKTITISDPAPSTVKETFTESLTNFTPIDPGTYNLDARTSPTGTPTGNLLNVNLEAGKLYTVILRGQSGNTTNPLGLTVIKHN